MNGKQETALRDVCKRFGVTFDPDHFPPTFDLPHGVVGGMVGDLFYVPCDLDGKITRR